MSSQQRRRTSKFAMAMIIVGVVMAGGIFWVLLSSWGGGGANEPLFRIENVTVPSKAETGDEIAIITTVWNIGGKEGTYALNPKVNGENLYPHPQHVSLKSGENREITTHFSEQEPGEYVVTVAEDNFRVRVYYLKPIEPRQPLEHVFWRVEMPDSIEDNAPTTLRLDVDAETGLKTEFYRYENDNATLLKESWLTKAEVERDKDPTITIGRGTPKTVTVVACIKGPQENLLYRKTNKLEAGDIRLSGFSLSKAWEENYTYRIRPRGKVIENLPVFVKRVGVSVDGENVRAVTPQGRYVPANPFPEAFVRSDIDKGYHTIKLTLFNERETKVASVENRRVVG